MQISKCHCGAPIGGEHHQSISSVTEINSPLPDEAFALYGFTYNLADKTPRLSHEVRSLLRIMTICALVVAIHTGKSKMVRTLLSTHTKNKDPLECL